jgi:hypothetical protein
LYDEPMYHQHHIHIFSFIDLINILIQDIYCIIVLL